MKAFKSESVHVLLFCYKCRNVGDQGHLRMIFLGLRTYCFGVQRVRLWLVLNSHKDRDPGSWPLPVAVSCVREAFWGKCPRRLTDLSVPAGIDPLKGYWTFWWLQSSRMAVTGSHLPGPRQHPVSNSFPLSWLILTLSEKHISAPLERLPTPSLNNSHQHI